MVLCLMLGRVSSLSPQSSVWIVHPACSGIPASPPPACWDHSCLVYPASSVGAKVQNCGPHACVTRTDPWKHLPRVTYGERGRERKRMCVHDCECAHVHPSTCALVCARTWKLEASSWICFHRSPPYVWRLGLSVNPELASLARRASH